MKLSKKVSKYLNPKILCKILLAILLVLVLFLLVKYLLKSREGFDGQKTLLLCHMNGCGHCDKLMPDWDKFARENKTDILTKKVEANEDTSLMKKHQVEGFPTILLLGSNGEKLDTYDGDRTKDGLLSYLQKL
tara:strand:- start:66 stop:464 length:399 start_codon:yes stop_codon:yes gene_type:complete